MLAETTPDPVRGDSLQTVSLSSSASTLIRSADPGSDQVVKHLIVAINFKEAINLARGLRSWIFVGVLLNYLYTIDFLESFIVSPIES